MNTSKIFRRNRSQRGQSLVEVALFFPIFIIMIAGLVEISNLLITQNRVTSATRAGARFLSNGGENAGTGDAILNTVTQTLNLDQNSWDVWVVRGTFNEDGTAILDNTWEFEHVYGISNTQNYADVDEANVRSLVLDELQRNVSGASDATIAGDLRFVGTYAIHDVDSILGLNAIPYLSGLTSVQELSVMRVIRDSFAQTNGCDGFPIAVHEGIRSVSPPGSTSNPYPASADYPNPLPAYASFVNHVADIPLRDAEEGYIFKVQDGFGNGNFGWLSWNEGIQASANTLNDSLQWPGNSSDYSDAGGGNGQIVAGSGFTHPVRGFIESGDPTDQAMHIGDWVAANTGSVNSNAVRTTLQGHITTDRALRLIVWDDSEAQGNNGRYRIVGFAIFKLIGYQLNQGSGDSFILAEFIRWDDSCGQETP
jgi:hypothetical protein